MTLTGPGSKGIFRFAAMACAAVLASFVLFASQHEAQAQGYTYRVNGEVLDQTMAQQMAYLGMPPGDYYIDRFGNFGMIGFPPVMNANGGAIMGQGQPGFGQPMQMGTGPIQTQPSQPGQQGFSGAGDGGLSGTRMFWIHSSTFGTGGSSGYFHLCPGGVFYRSSEGSFSLGGEYNSRTGTNDPWVGAAGTSRGAGQWSVQGGTLMLRATDGGSWQFRVSDVQRGTRWKVGQFTYAAERGRATCP